jgi:hypothetical protein
MPAGKVWYKEGSDEYYGETPPDINDPSWGQWRSIDVLHLTRGQYLFTAQDSVERRKDDYKGKGTIEGDIRLAFVDGIHLGDTFYVLPKTYEYSKAFTAKIQRNPELYLYILPWYKKHYLGENTHYEPRWFDEYPNDGDYEVTATPNRLFENALSYDLKHAYNGKSMVFQFRLRNLGDVPNAKRNFFIESERGDGMEIGPDKASFINNHNGATIVSQKDVEFPPTGIYWNDAALGMNVKGVEADDENKATSVEAATVDGAKVIGGVGSVTILNAAGKTVTVTNVLGQVVAKTVATGDNATIALPKGIVVVSVDGTSSKALVK